MKFSERTSLVRLILLPAMRIVTVEVELVVPRDDSSEPCLESETVQFLRNVKEHADRGDVNWLSQRGKVYAAVGSA